MGSAPQYVFPGALLGSIILALVAFMVTAGLNLPPTSPASALAAEAGEQASEPVESASGEAVVEDSEPEEAEQDQEEQEEQEADCDVSRAYPDSILQWCDLITKFSNRNDLDPDLIAALIWQESGGDPVAYSKSGAVGLMQVMPRDGIAASFMCKNGPCFTNRPSIAELEDPKFNVKYGTGMLKNLLDKYGDMREALKYYGPKDVGYYYADKVLGIFEEYRK